MKPREITLILEKQRQLIINCSDTFNDIRFMQGEELTQKEREILHFFQWRYIIELMWNYMILELNKLYSKSANDKFRFYGILNILSIKCKKAPYSSIPNLKDSIFSLKQIMDSEDFAERFQKIQNIRDWYVAHLDKNTDDLRVENEDIEYFLILNDRILKEVIDPITGGISHLGAPATLRDFIKKMASYKSVHDKLEEGVRPGNISPETEKELLKILGKNNFLQEGVG